MSGEDGKGVEGKNERVRRNNISEHHRNLSLKRFQKKKMLFNIFNYTYLNIWRQQMVGDDYVNVDSTYRHRVHI